MPPLSPASRRAYDRAFARLAALTDYETMARVAYSERTYGLDRAAALLDDLGRPGDRLPTVQVVGSKGKGTTSTAAACILRAAGLRTGLYTSPHLEHPSERILVDGAPVPGKRFEAAVDRVLPLALARAGGDRPTFFELMTATALLLFAGEGCDAVVLEAGMGGRLDATTAARRDAVLLTSVSLEHTAQLGRSRARIAGEKAAAARRGVPFWSLVPPDSPAGRVVAATCAAAGAPLRTAPRDFAVLEPVTSLEEGGPAVEFDLRARGSGTLRDLRMPQLGIHQAGNGGLAAAALLDLGRRGVVPVDGGAVRRGLAEVRLGARLEVRCRRPLVVVDGSHDRASVQAARRALRAAGAGGRLLVVFAAQRDKDLDGMLRALRGAARLHATETTGARRTPAGAIARRARGLGIPSTPHRDPAAALEAALRAATEDDTVLVCGSLYLAGALGAEAGRPRLTSTRHQ